MSVSTTRSCFQGLARERIEEARALFRSGHYSGAYYLAGYAVDFSLKAVICQQFQRHALPDKDLVQKSFQHNLEQLLAHSNLADTFKKDRNADPQLNTNWSTISLWREGSRYRRTSKIEAKNLIQAIDGGPSSFLSWVQLKW